MFGIERHANESVFASVATDDGDEYSGVVIAYSTDNKPVGERELVLGLPLTLRRGDEVIELENWQRLVVPGDKIASLLVSYVERDAVASDR